MEMNGADSKRTMTRLMATMMNSTPTIDGDERTMAMDPRLKENMMKCETHRTMAMDPRLTATVMNGAMTTIDSKRMKTVMNGATPPTINGERTMAMDPHLTATVMNGAMTTIDSERMKTPSAPSSRRSVIFVDELDGLFRKRGGEDHDVGRDLKTEFLQLWDGVRDSRDDASGGSSVLVIGATNRPFDVDPAFLRRMPRRVYVGPPDYDSRLSVLRGMLGRVPLDSDFDVDLVASRTEGYSPSDIREVLQAAALYPLREAREEAMSSSRIDGGDAANGEEIGMLRMPPLRRLRTDDVLRALRVARPTQFSRRYQKELTNYLRKSGGSIGMDEAGADLPSYTERDVNDREYIVDTGSHSGERPNHGNADESDSDSLEDSSDSDYD